MARAAAIAIVAGAVAAAVALGIARRGKDEGARCGPGFVVEGTRCRVPGATCPAPLVRSESGCDAPDVRVRVPGRTVLLGPSDWEAEGRVSPRLLSVRPFWIDAFEVTRGRWAAAGERPDGTGAGGADPADRTRAASGMTREQASKFCAAAGGRLPTEDEWIVAAVSARDPPQRYPWGDTGAVCRRAAWGLASGPCAAGGDGPDTVGSHPSGDTPLGLHDLAGNVAEWVASAGSAGVEADRMAIAKGGSWQTSLASELRVWARLELPVLAGDPRVGLRCAYDERR